MDLDCQQPSDSSSPSFTFPGFVAHLARTGLTLPTLLTATVSRKRLDPRLRERIMVSVSSMNHCRHCTAIHSVWGELAGLTPEEVEGAKKASPDGLEPHHWLVLEYARLVSLGGSCSDEARALEPDLAEYFSKKEIEHIRAVTLGIDLANKCGNTWDAFLHRISGTPEADSSLLDELLVLASIAPVGLPFLAVSKTARTITGER